MMNPARTEQGLVSGTHREGVHRFLGLPYAAPPVGGRRWAPPAPPVAWEGVREATTFGNAAIQTAGPGDGLGAPQSEDCLYLNVWTTTVDPAARQPVMVWIHGGGFLYGAASMPLYDGTGLAQRLYAEDPRLGHAAVEFRPRLERMTALMIAGMGLR
jgi:para-nitrobenzyl esterase